MTVKNDYVIVRDAKGKFKFGKVKTAKHGIKVTINDSLVHEKHAYILTDDETNVIVNFGSDVPAYGKAYGCDIEPLLDSYEDGQWGTINLFRKHSKREKKILDKVLLRSYLKLKKAKLTALLPIEIDVRNNNGSKVGLHYYDKKRPAEVIEIMHPDYDKMEMLDTLMHEYGHGIMAFMMQKKHKAAWIKLYHRFVKMDQLNTKYLTHLRKEIEEAGSITAFLKHYDTEKDKAPIKTVLKECFSHIYAKHKLSKRDLQDLLEAGKSIKDFWPDTILDISEVKQILTEYSKKNAHEFWSEAFSLHMMGKKLPKSVRQLMDETLSNLNKKGIVKGKVKETEDDSDSETGDSSTD